MLLNQTQFDWNDRVTRKAHELGFQVYEQATRNKRVADPSLLLIKGPRIIAVWLRTGRRREDRQPPTDRFPPAVERYVWYPPDWAQVNVTLMTAPRGDDGAA